MIAQCTYRVVERREDQVHFCKDNLLEMLPPEQIFLYVRGARALVGKAEAQDRLNIRISIKDQW